MNIRVTHDGRIIEQTVDNGDGTGTRTRYDETGKPVETVEVKDLPVEPVKAKTRRTLEEATTALLTLTAETTLQAHADRIPPEQAATFAPLLPEWAPGEQIDTGALRTADHTIYEAIQGHATQDDWHPTKTPALWRQWRQPDTVQPWAQPAGSHDAYQIGDRVTHNGKTWKSTVNANVWEPGVYGWEAEQ